MVVVDIGARVGHYCGDLTRTYPAGAAGVAPAYGDRGREIYDLVLAAHRNAVLAFRFGEDSLDTMNARCKSFLEASPMRSRDADGEERTMDRFMPHSLGHHLGMDVHDVGERDTPLPAGSVITIEPGLYLPAERIGVRLEDDYVVTPEGLRRLGPDLEVDAAAVEAAMRGL